MNGKYVLGHALIKSCGEKRIPEGFSAEFLSYNLKKRKYYYVWRVNNLKISNILADLENMNVQVADKKKIKNELLCLIKKYWGQDAEMGKWKDEPGEITEIEIRCSAVS